jgi:exodeoxyribonuclease V alpha subunit
LLLVDECSMIDAALFARLMRSVQGKTHLVLVGDPYQLPAVEGGSFFADLIASHALPTTFLTRPLRFGKSALVELAQAILEGKGDRIPFIPLPDDMEWLWEKVKGHFPKPHAAPPESIEGLNRFRILSALRRGPMGVEALNDYLMHRFQSLGKGGDYFAAPIMIARNDVRTGLCNGEMGLLIHQIGSYEGDYALFEGGKRLPRAALPRFEYAYATSVHKSQGSEYDEVLVLLPEGSEAFGRELLYTAATRAKERLEIAGDPARIALMLKQLSGKISGVSEKLQVCAHSSS